MERTGDDVAAAIAGVTPAARRRDAEALVALMRDVTGLEPELWTGKIVGFGEYHYRYESGREGDSPAVGFAPRKAATTIYLPDGVGAHEQALSRLGPHTTGVGCLYLKALDDVDLAVLRGIVETSFRTLTSGTYGHRARDGGA
ncbi:DUF1801 domain-containing protein [Microbacterium sp. No. 7]|uniref:DUF1801 domain-containing protein n=1 Tax=Microbacterium sp. No. 7 TaxID=1714373 RepID=UPI0006D177AB|nr:DUF1801 domain-containing protein [Microbacterium sp. No. 7]ALJ21742.1 hypothetical protein AOA12_18330 [Microbacterium sp. No. 7]